MAQALTIVVLVPQAIHASTAIQFPILVSQDIIVPRDKQEFLVLWGDTIRVIQCRSWMIVSYAQRVVFAMRQLYPIRSNGHARQVNTV